MSNRISVKEFLVIQQLREKLADLDLDDEKNSDEYLIKWLRVQNLDLDKGEQMLRKSLIWRKENEIDKIFEWVPPEGIKNAVPMCSCGYDEEGNSVVVTLMKNANPGIILSMDKSLYIKYRIQTIEKLLRDMRERNKSLGLPGNQFISINDLDGVNISSILTSRVLEFKSLVQEVTQTVEDNYPETVKMAFLPFAPRSITLIMGIVRPFIPKSAKNKIKIFDSNKDKWKQEILAHVPPHVLPVKYGGTNDSFPLLSSH